MQTKNHACKDKHILTIYNLPCPLLVRSTSKLTTVEFDRI